jgi:uncharacterized protein YndB with AHSA1/START domain
MARADETVVVERWLPVPPAIAFWYFTEADKWIRWNGSAAWIDPRPGGSLRIAAYGDFAVGVFQEIVPARTWSLPGAGKAVRRCRPRRRGCRLTLSRVEAGRYCASPTRGCRPRRSPTATGSAGTSTWV